MDIEEMLERAHTCAHHPLNRQDRIVVEEIWMATIEICKRLEQVTTDHTITPKDVEAYLRGRCQHCNETKNEHRYILVPNQAIDDTFNGRWFCADTARPGTFVKVFSPYGEHQTPK